MSSVIEACTRKVKIWSKAHARESRNRLRRSEGSRISFYECPTCGSYHLTGMRQEEVRARSRR